MPARPPTFTQPWIVATMHDRRGLAEGLKMKPGQAADLLELRLDAFPERDPGLLKKIQDASLPLVITARHPAEGAVHPLNVQARRALFQQFLSHASFFDIELRSLRSLRSTLLDAQAAGTGLIVSCHDFRSTPTIARLRDLARRAADAGADIFKIATTPSRPAHFFALLQLLEERPGNIPVAAMGMGPSGRASRLLFAQHGSVLVYGHLGSPQVPGQFPAKLLRQRLGEAMASA